MKLFYTTIILTILLLSCFNKKRISGHYALQQNDYNEYWQLWYDNGNGLSHGRIDSIGKIGWTDKYIFVEKREYYFIDKGRDSELLNSQEIVDGPFSKSKFMFFLDSLKINYFKFRYEFDINN